jgi:hypothetical protein
VTAFAPSLPSSDLLPSQKKSSRQKSAHVSIVHGTKCSFVWPKDDYHLNMQRPQRDFGHKLVAKFGGGVNTWAMLILLARECRRPDAILMADPGDEWPETEAYRDGIGAEWLRSKGFPPVTVVSRMNSSLELRGYKRNHIAEIFGSFVSFSSEPRITKTESLFDECDRLAMPPSAAFGRKRCSMQYKADPSLWWLQAQPWVNEEVEQGRRIAIAIGYDYGEHHRYEGRDEFTSSKTEAKLSFPVYPLVRAKLDRDACIELIRREELPIPPKSACRRCPNNTIEDWYRLAEQYPEIYMQAVELSRKSESNVDSDAVGLLRRALPDGKRRLHIWHDGGYENVPPPPVVGRNCGRESTEDALRRLADEDDRDDMPCECAL